MKICKDCGIEKELIEFYNNKKNSTRLSSYCKNCDRQRSLSWYENNKQHVNNKSKNWRKNNLKKSNDSHRKSLLKIRYGITQEEYIVLSINQNNKCAICNREETAKSKNGILKLLSVDHNHFNGIIRELLCQKCNSVIGYSQENIDILKSAIEYLEKHNDVT